jgi:hypothetical protein
VLATVPQELASFFSVMAQCGAALLGLLFVTVSIRRGTDATREARESMEAVVLADATFFALADGFVVSSAALHPKLDVAYAALGMSAFGIAWTIRAFRCLIRAWAKNASLELRSYRFNVVWPNLTGLLLNAAQIYVAVRLLIRPRDISWLEALGTVLLAYYTLALLRAWTLVGGAHYGLRAALSEARREPTRVMLKERHFPPWPHVHHGPRGPSRMTQVASTPEARAAQVAKRRSW